MSENIQQSFIYKNKTYKTLGTAQGTRIRSINKDIIDLKVKNILTNDINEKRIIENKITKREKKLKGVINERERIREKKQKETRKKQKQNRMNAQFFKNNFEVENNAPQKLTLDERLVRRNRAIEENKIPINGLNFREKRDIKRVYETKAFGDRVTENYIYDDDDNRLGSDGKEGKRIEDIVKRDDYIVRDNIIISNLMNQLYIAQNNKMILKAQLMVSFMVFIEKENRQEEKYSISSMFFINTKNDISNLIEDLMQEFERTLEILLSSGKRFVRYTKLKIITAKQTKKDHLKTLAGNYIELSEEIKKSQGVSNIKNLDDKCLEYCLIAFRYKNQIKSKDTSNPNIYKKYFQFIKSPENQQYPISIEEDVPKYEVLNDIKIVVYKLNNGQFLPFFKSNYKSKEVLNLLLIEDGKIIFYV